MLSKLHELAAQILLSVLLAGIAAGGGWLIGRDQVQKKWDLSTAQATSLADKTLREDLEEATRKGNILSSQLADAESTINKLTLEKTHALAKTTTGTLCLNARTVGVLNRSTPAATGAVPAAAGAPAADDGATASDTDVATWIAHAQGQFDTCRRRLDALVEFERQR